MKREFRLSLPHGHRDAALELPEAPRGVVLWASLHAAFGPGSVVATAPALGFAGIALRLLNTQEAGFADSAHNTPLLAERLLAALDWLARDADTAGLPLALLAEAAVTPAAIRVAASRDRQVQCLVCHGGLPDGAGRQYLEWLRAPLLMLADASDQASVARFSRVQALLGGPSELRVLPGGHGPDRQVLEWMARHLATAAGDPATSA